VFRLSVVRARLLPAKKNCCPFWNGPV